MVVGGWRFINPKLSSVHVVARTMATPPPLALMKIPITFFSILKGNCVALHAWTKWTSLSSSKLFWIPPPFHSISAHVFFLLFFQLAITHQRLFLLFWTCYCCSPKTYVLFLFLGPWSHVGVFLLLQSYCYCSKEISLLLLLGLGAPPPSIMLMLLQRVPSSPWS